MIEQREYSYAELVAYLQNLAIKFPFLKLTQLGTSVAGHPIYSAQIGIDTKKVLYAGGFHGSERLTCLVLIMFLENLCETLADNTDFSLTNARSALFGKSVLAVPCVNPDGYEISLNGPATAGTYADSVRQILGNNEHKYWNANVRGVDINHNFDAGFEILKQLERQQGITGPAPRRYGGQAPESEPETKIMADLCRNNDILQLLAFHSQGEEIYWQYGEYTPEKSYRLARLFETASGYKMAAPSGTASHGGFKDWFIQAFNRPGFTLEIGKGENPLPPDQLYSIYARLYELFLLSFAL